jgi:hypothetical protein
LWKKSKKRKDLCHICWDYHFSKQILWESDATTKLRWKLKDESTKCKCQSNPKIMDWKKSEVVLDLVFEQVLWLRTQMQIERRSKSSPNCLESQICGFTELLSESWNCLILTFGRHPIGKDRSYLLCPWIIKTLFLIHLDWWMKTW